MKYMVVGDLQVYGSDPDFYGNHRLGYTNRTIDWILSQLANELPDVFVYLGDLGEDNTGVSMPSMHAICRLMSGVDDIMNGRPSYWLVGNHDYFTRDGSVNLMSSLGPLVPEFATVAWPYYIDEQNKVGYISYLSNKTEFLELLAEHPVDLLFCHQPIQGSFFGNGMYDPDGVDPKSLPAMTVVGHYHHANVVGQNGQNILYAGSPMSVNFSDNIVGADYKVRGVWLVEPEHELRMLQNPFTQYYATVRADTVEEIDRQLDGAELSRLHLRVITDQPLKLDETLYASVSVLKNDRQKVVQRTNISLDTSPEDSIGHYVEYKQPTQDSTRLSHVGMMLMKGTDPLTSNSRT